ncbi:MAG: protoheme IX farnesyltransferase [Chloroflexi bacterium]|nr:protoheme IX farnesyltransferase [Chloroflexota bacterium]
MKGFQRLALAAAIATYFLMVVGAVVRTTESGLGCPDWPLCHGRLIPPLEFTAVAEYSHRLVGAAVSALIVTVAGAAWAVRRRERSVMLASNGVIVLLAVQIALGAVTVYLELPPPVVAVHLSLAMLILAALIWVAVAAGPAPRLKRPADLPAGRVPGGSGFVRWVVGVTLAGYGLVLTGALMRATGASWACRGFPDCNGELLPFGAHPLVDVHLFHRLTAYGVALLVGLTVVRAWPLRSHLPALWRSALAVGLAVVAQIALGATAVTLGPGALVQSLHVAGAAAVWASLVTLLALTLRSRHLLTGRAAGLHDLETASLSRLPHTVPPGGGQGSMLPFALVEARSGGRRLETAALPAAAVAPAPAPVFEAVSWRRMALAYVALTKPRIIWLLLVTTLGAMLVAAEGLPPLALVLWTMLGGALGAGSANAINCYLDRDIDTLMRRTNERPIPAGLVTPTSALGFGLALGLLSFTILTAFVNLLAALLTMAGLLFYVFVYTRWLKRTTPSNIVIGGAAGAVPPLVGWAAVTGEISLLAVYLFAIIFFWTPPHFWALSLLIRREYERARIPMLPVVRGDEETRRQILRYTVLLVALTVALVSIGLMGGFYLAAALVLGGLFLYYAARLRREATTAAARRLFQYSILYLVLLFAAMVLDRRMFL